MALDVYMIPTIAVTEYSTDDDATYKKALLSHQSGYYEEGIVVQ